MRTESNAGVRGIALVAITYVYFLIFAQFGFLARLAALGITGNSVRVVMGAMALGGILFSLLAPGLAPFFTQDARLRIGFGICAIAAGIALLPLNVATGGADAFLIGAGLGILTVTLVSNLHTWTGPSYPLVKVGLGTGLGYFVCNIPLVFTASAEKQALLSALLCATGILLTFRPPRTAEQPIAAPREHLSFGYVLACFAALVWLDSAAFYIIQHVPSLKAGTWAGSAHLWTNACLHFAAAVAAGALLARKSLAAILSAAFLALACACVLLLNAQTLSASLFYPVGVSLYSVALVAYPSFLTSAASPAQRARQAASLYAIAGWIGSTMGIGMGQNLGHVPAAFVALAGVVILLPLGLQLVRSRARELSVLAAVLVLALFASRLLPHAAEPSASAIERGRQVYISEGCIHCHSQYVRPNSPDVLLWGPVESLAALHRQRPPLIGNRRQGPDLSQVGSRRSPLWLKAHLYDPAQITGGSIMPSFAMLFNDSRGEDLVAYLASLQSGNVTGHLAEEQAWRPSALAEQQANPVEGHREYQKFCGTCHDSDGATRVRWQSALREQPADVVRGPFRYPAPADPDQRRARFEQVAKFGIPGTDMPGHEYLSDHEIASLDLWLNQQRTEYQRSIPTPDSTHQENVP
jgi:cytochrome c oxidase cbb3-type subunit 2